MGRCIGIDFGTTNTIVYWRNKKGIAKNMLNGPIKTAVYFKSKNEYIIGKKAIEESRDEEKPQALVMNFKPRIRGEKYNIIAENGDEFKLTPIAVARIFLNDILHNIIYKKFQSAYGSSEFKDDDKVIITVPIKFNPEEKKAIKTAAEKAGFTNVSIAFEPTAAAIAVMNDIKTESLQNNIIAVYDFGGGTFDVSVIQNKGGAYKPLEKGHGGDKKLGGNDITLKILQDIVAIKINNYVSEQLDDDEKVFLNQNPYSDDFDFEDCECDCDEDIYRINWDNAYEIAEDVKFDFSDSYTEEETYTLNIKYNDDNREVKEIFCKFNITKKEFEECVTPLIQRTVDICSKVISETMEFNNVKINKLIMAGGSSQLNIAYTMLSEAFEKYDIKVVKDPNLFELISKGALIIGETKKDLSIEERTATQLGIAEKVGPSSKRFVPLIMEDQLLPVSGTKQFVISSYHLREGSITVNLYEKDSKIFPDAEWIDRDEGLNKMEEYKIPLGSGCETVECLDVVFTIDEDGTLKINLIFLDGDKHKIKKENYSFDMESDLM